MSRIKSILEPGEKIIVRTVTHFFVGRLVELDADFIALEESSWIGDTGIWNECLMNGTFDEVQPQPGTHLVARAGLIDIARWNHDLPQVGDDASKWRAS